MTPHPCEHLSAAVALTFDAIAEGQFPGPGQYRSLVRQLLAAGLIQPATTQALDDGVGPENRVAVYTVPLDVRAAWEAWRGGIECVDEEVRC